MKSQKYTIDEILEAKFKKKMFGGLKAEHVDDFLNGVIDDYEYFIEKISELKKVNEDLRNENFKIKMNVLKQATNTLDLSKEEELSVAPELVEVSRVEERPTYAETPSVEAPVVEATVVETPSVEAPVVETPSVEAPVIETPIVEQSVVESPVVEETVVESPVVEETVETSQTNNGPSNEAEILEELKRLKAEMEKLQNK